MSHPAIPCCKLDSSQPIRILHPVFQKGKHIFEYVWHFLTQKMQRSIGPSGGSETPNNYSTYNIEVSKKSSCLMLLGCCLALPSNSCQANCILDGVLNVEYLPSAPHSTTQSLPWSRAICAKTIGSKKRAQVLDVVPSPATGGTQLPSMTDVTNKCLFCPICPQLPASPLDTQKKMRFPSFFGGPLKGKLQAYTLTGRGRCQGGLQVAPAEFQLYQSFINHKLELCSMLRPYVHFINNECLGRELKPGGQQHPHLDQTRKNADFEAESYGVSRYPAPKWETPMDTPKQGLNMAYHVLSCTAYQHIV